MNAYLNARIAVLASRLLSEAQLAYLIHGGEYREEEPLPAALQTLLEHDTTEMAVIEQAWLMHMLADFQILLRPLSGVAHDLLIYWLRKCDIANLKTIVRGKLGGLTAETIKTRLLTLDTLTALPTESLLHTEDINELLRQLEHSRYRDIARAGRRVFEKDHQLYSLDAAIDRHYLAGFVQRVRALDANQRRYLLPLVGVFMDRFNLLWLLRYRFAYELSPAETYYLLVSTPYQLHSTYLKELVECNSLTEVLSQLPATLQSLLAEAHDITTVDQRLIQAVRQVALYTLKYHAFTFAKVFAYVLLREMEMRRVMAIVKGKHLGFNTDLIAQAAEYTPTLMA